MRRIISFFLSFVLLFSNLAFDYENVQAAQSPSISFSSDGNLAKPVVTATINTDGLKIVGITYDRGYGQTATGKSKRIYGYEGQTGTVSVPLTDVTKYVSVYAVLADENNAKTTVEKSYTLTGNRVYNTSSNTFAPYPTTPLNDDTNTDTLVYDTIGTTSGDNGPMIVVDDQVWAFNDGGQMYIYETDKLDGYFSNVGAAYDVPRTQIATDRAFDEHGTSILYDGRYVIAIDNQGYLYSIDVNNPAQVNHSNIIRNPNKVFTNYSTVANVYSGQVRALAYDNYYIYIITSGGYVYRATPSADGSTYTIGTTALGSYGATGGLMGSIDVNYDGSNLWIVNSTSKIYKYNLSTNTSTSYNVKDGGTVSAIIYDGSQYFYTSAIEARSSNLNGMYRFTAADPANGTRVYTDSGITVGGQEGLVYDGRNIWQLNYNITDGATFRYDTATGTKKTISKSQITADRSKAADGGLLRHAVSGVYDGKYQWIFRYSIGYIDAIGRTMNLKFGPSGTIGALNKDITRTFDDSKVTDPTTTVYVDEKETTSPNYVVGKTADGVSTSDIVFGAWTYDKTQAAAATRNDDFFKDLTKAIDTSAMDKTDWNSFRNYEGSYFTIPKGELPKVTNGKFSYSLTTYPKLNGYYTLYMVNADGKPYYETFYVDNYKELTRLYINFEDKDTKEVVKQTMDDTFAMGATATVKYATYAAELAAEGYELADATSKTTTMDTASKEITFIVSKDKTKWSEIIYKPYYINNKGTRVELGEVKSGKYYLVNDPYVAGDATTLAKYNRKAKIDATHIDGFKLATDDPSPREVAFPSTAGGTKDAYGRTEVAFKYVPESSVVVVKGIGVDASGKATGEVAYSTYKTGNLYDEITVTADTVPEWSFKGLATVDGSGNVTNIANGTNSFKATFGTHDIVYFAYTHNANTIKVNYVRSDSPTTILGTDSFTVEENDSVTLVPKEIKGYMLAAGEPASQVVKSTAANAAITYTFKYEPIPTVVNVKGIEVDASNNPTGTVVYSTQVKGEDGASTLVNADETLTNWTAVGLANYDASGNFTGVATGTKSKTVTLGTDFEVVFAYTRKTTDVTVQYMLEGTTTEIATADTFKIPLNTKFSATARAVEGYKLVDNNAYKTTESVMDGTQAPIIFYYQRIKETITIEARLDNESGKLLAADSLDSALGATNVTVSPLSLQNMLSPRYEFVSASSTNPATVSVVQQDSKVIFIFKEMKQTVTVNYYETGTSNKVATTRTFDVAYGEKYSDYAISIDGYYIANGDPLSFTDKVANTPTATYDYKYTKSAGAILVQAIDETTGAILEQYVKTGTNGSALTFDVSGFTGSWKTNYTLKDPTVVSGSKTMVYTGTLQEMTFVYKRETYDLILTAKDDTTNAPLDFYDGSSTKKITYYKGETYNVYAPPVKGYTVSGAPTTADTDGITADAAFTFLYKAVDLTVGVAVRAVSEDGKTIIGTKTVKGARETTTSIDITDTQFKGVIYDPNQWELVATEQPIKSVEFGKNYEVDFKFKRKAVNLTVEYWDTTSGSAIQVDAPILVNVGSTEKVVAKQFPNYELAPGQQNIMQTNIGTSDLTIRINYVKAAGNVTIYVRDAETGALLERKYDNPPIGSGPYTVPYSIASSFNTASDPAYYYEPSTSVTTLNYIDPDLSRNIIYLDYKVKRYTVTVQYVDAAGNKLLDDKVITNVAHGTYIEEYAANKAFYNLTNKYPAVQKINGVTSDTTLTFEYVEILIPDATINLIAKAEDGTILKIINERGTVGQEVRYGKETMGDFDGYQLVTTDDQVATLVNGFNNLYFVYKPVYLSVTIKATATVNGVPNTPISFDPGTVQNYPVQAKGAITVYAPQITGYVVDGVQSISFTDITKSETATFNYAPIDKMVVLKGIEVDATGKPVINNGVENVVYSKVVPGYDNTSRVINAVDGLSNWTLVGLVDTSTNTTATGVTSKSVNLSTDKEVVFGYTRKTNNVTVTYVDAATGASIKTTTNDVFTVPSNTDYTITAKAIDGYELVDSSKYTQTFTVAGETFKQFNYQKLQHNVLIKAVDSSGKLLAQYTENLPVGNKNVNVTSDKIAALISPRYILDTTKNASIYTIPEVQTDTVVTYVFKEQVSTITVNYLNGATVIATPKVYTVPYGTKIVESAASVKDYYVDLSKNQPTYTVDGAVQPAYNINFQYVRSNGDISVIAKDVATGEILSYKTYTGTQGTALSVTENSEFGGKPFLTYYTLDSSSNGSQSLNYTNSHQEIVFNYKKVLYTVTLKAQDVEGNPLKFYNGKDVITQVYKKGDKYEVYAPPTYGYYVEPTTPSSYSNTTGILADATHTFVYKKVELGTNIMIKAVSEDGKTLVGSKVVSNERETKETININDHTDLFNQNEWEVIPSQTTAEVVYGVDKEVTFKLKRKTVSVTVKYVAEGTEADVAPQETITGVPTNTAFTAVSKVAKNFVLADSQTQSKTINSGTSNQIVTFYYVPADGNIIIEAIDEETGDIIARYYDNANEGDAYVTKDTIKTKFSNQLIGYTYNTGSDDKIAVVNSDASKNIVTLKYSKQMSNVIVHYVDADGKKIAEDKNYKVQYHRGFDEYALNFESYNLTGNVSHISVKDVTAPVYEYTFKYYLDDACVINVVAKTVEGDILGIESYIGTLGNQVSFDAQQIFGTMTGYKLDDTQVKAATYKNGLVTVEFIYSKVGLSVKIEAIDNATGLPLAFSEPSVIAVQEGQTITVYAPHISKYEVIAPSYVELKDIKASQTVTFKYRKIDVPSRIVVKHIAYVNGNEVVVKTENYSGNVGEAITVKPLDSSTAAALGYRINSNYDQDVVTTFKSGSNSDVVFLYDRIMSTLYLNYNVEIYNSHEQAASGTPSSTLSEGEKATRAPQLMNTSQKYALGSTQTVVAPFENEYVINTSKNTHNLRKNVKLDDPIRTLDYYYRNITGNVLLRAVVEDPNGSVVINGKNYRLLAQIDDNCAVGSNYINASIRRRDLDSLLSPSYAYDQKGPITGTEVFVPKAGDTYKDHTLTYVYTADYKFVNIYFKDVDGNKVPETALGIDSNPLTIQVINGDYISQYALNAQNYNFVGSKLTTNSAMSRALAMSTTTLASDYGLSDDAHLNIPVDSDTNWDLVYEKIKIFQGTQLVQTIPGSPKTTYIDLVPGQILYAPYVDGFRPSPLSYKVGSVVDSKYEFTYAAIPKQLVQGETQYIYREYTAPEPVINTVTNTVSVVDHSATEFVHEAYVSGYPDGTFRADKNITRAEVVAILYNLIHEETDTTVYSNKFPDVKQDAWYTEAINYMSSKGYINGYTDGTFKPSQNITREEFAAIISGVFGTSNVKEFDSLPLDPTRWSTPHIINTYTSGYYDGIDLTNYNFKQKITRAEVIVMINNATNRVPNTNYDTQITAIPTDLSKTHWAYWDILEATIGHTGYVEGNFGNEREIIYSGKEKIYTSK